MLKKHFMLPIAVLMATGFSSKADNKYFTRNGNITFDASSPLEKIEAVNEKGASVFDVASGQIEFSVLMKAFYFEKALMQEHFNENYVESDKYPKAIFKGTLANPASINVTKDGAYQSKVKGQLTLHGVTKDVESLADFIVKGGVVTAAADFTIEPANYKIEIPSLVKEKIAKTIHIKVHVNYELLK
jgi:hypothetical protein